MRDQERTHTVLRRSRRDEHSWQIRVRFLCRIYKRSNNSLILYSSEEIRTGLAQLVEIQIRFIVMRDQERIYTVLRRSGRD
jgi:hypothetical protein